MSIDHCLGWSTHSTFWRLMNLLCWRVFNCVFIKFVNLWDIFIFSFEIFFKFQYHLSSKFIYIALWNSSLSKLNHKELESIYKSILNKRRAYSGIDLYFYFIDTIIFIATLFIFATTIISTPIIAFTFQVFIVISCLLFCHLFSFLPKLFINNNVDENSWQ